MSTVTPNLGLTLPAVHDEDWGVPTLNEDFTLIDDFAATVVLYAPTLSQTVTQPTSTYFNFNYPIVFLSVNPALRFGTAANMWDSAITRTGAGVFSVDTNAVGNGLGTLGAATLNTGNLNATGAVTAPIVNATTGFRVNGAAPSGHFLVGNGTNYVDSSTIPTGSANYQVVQLATVALPSRNVLNILAPLSAVDDPGNSSTDVGLANSGATAGTYTKPTMTVTAKGLVSSIASGVGVTATVTDITSGTTTGTVYQNTNVNAVCISGNANSNTGTSTCHISVVIGPTSSPAMAVWSAEFGATVANGSIPFYAVVPAGWYWEIVVAGDVGWGGSSLAYQTVLS